LFVAHFQIGTEGLPNDEGKLANIARVSPKVWKKIRPAIIKHFHYMPDVNGNPDGGHWVSDWCITAIERIEDISAQNRAKALNRWKR
jgi:hypothetical protein